MANTRKPMDVWLMIEEDEELTTYEANTYRDGDGFVIEWYHSAVGQVTSVYCTTYTAAIEWYLTNGYADYTDYSDPSEWDEATPGELTEQEAASAEFYRTKRN